MKLTSTSVKCIAVYGADQVAKFAQIENSVHAVGTVVNHPELPCMVLK